MGITCCHEETTIHVFDLPSDKNWSMIPLRIKYNKPDYVEEKLDYSKSKPITIDDYKGKFIENFTINIDRNFSKTGITWRRKIMNLAYNNYFLLTEDIYFKDQNPKSINSLSNLNKEDLNDKKLLLDPLFPHNFNSISNLGKKTPLSQGDRKIMEALSWERPEIFFKTDNYALYDHVDIDDVYQGSLENCYFLSSISAMAAFPYRIEKLFIDKDITENGVYSVKYYIEGVPIIVSVNDYFPCSKNRWIFSYNKSNEIWCQVMEKAWAKLHGSYYNSMLGLPSECLEAISEAPSEYLIHKKFKLNKLFDLMNYCFNKKYVMVATSKRDSEILKYGIINSHAYTILGLHTINREQQETPLQMIKLRNPWGGFEWNGSYCDSDPKWTTEMKRELGMLQKNDGIFFMEFTDFVKFFDYTFISMINDNYTYSYVKLKQAPKTSVLITGFNLTEADLSKNKNEYLYLILNGKSTRFYYKMLDLENYLKIEKENKNLNLKLFNNKSNNSNYNKYGSDSEILNKISSIVDNDKMCDSFDFEYENPDSFVAVAKNSMPEVVDDFNVKVNHPEIFYEGYDFDNEEEVLHEEEKLEIKRKGNQNLSLVLAKYDRFKQSYTYVQSISVPGESVHIHIKFSDLTAGEYHVISHTIKDVNEQNYNDELYDLVLSAYSPKEIKFEETPYTHIPEDYLIKIIKNYLSQHGKNLSKHNENSYGYIKRFKIGEGKRQKQDLCDNEDEYFEFSKNKFIEQYSLDNLEVVCSDYINNKFIWDYIAVLFINKSSNMIADASFEACYINNSLICLNEEKIFTEKVINVNLETSLTQNLKLKKYLSKQVSDTDIALDSFRNIKNSRLKKEPEKSTFLGYGESRNTRKNNNNIQNTMEMSNIRNEINNLNITLNEEFPNNSSTKNDNIRSFNNINSNLSQGNVNYNELNYINVSENYVVNESNKAYNFSNTGNNPNSNLLKKEQLKYTINKFNIKVFPNSEQLVVFKYNTIDKKCELSINNLMFGYKRYEKEELFKVIIDKYIDKAYREEINKDCYYCEIEYFEGILIVFFNKNEESPYRFKINLEELENLKIASSVRNNFIFTVYPNKYEYIVLEKIKPEFEIDYDIEYVYKKI